MDTSHLAEHAGTAGALFASVFLIATYTMTTMIPLRIFGILTNLVLILTFSFTTGNYHTMVLHMVLLVLERLPAEPDASAGARREESVNSDLSIAWLKPFMTERKTRGRRGPVLQGREGRGDVLYRQRPFRLVESGIEVPVGSLTGESACCRRGRAHPDAGMHRNRLDLGVTYSKVEELYVQNPAFGFYFLRLVSARLFQNLATLLAAAGTEDRGCS